MVLHLIKKYIENNISQAELNQLEILLKDEANLKIAESFLREDYTKSSEHLVLDTDKALEKFKTITEKKSSKIIVLRPYFKYVAAAVVVIGVFLGSRFINSNSSNIDAFDDSYKPQSITLILDDGTEKILTKTLEGSIINSEKNIVANTENGNLIYDTSKILTSISYNTLKVPYGERFSITLSDGSKVELNSGSILKYPVAFLNEGDRDVYLEEGEAYFDVAKDTQRTFIVHTEKQNIKVLGTRFCVSNYANESTIKTTLEEGLVNVVSAIDSNKIIQLNPNEQTVFYRKDNTVLKQPVDVSKSLAWKKNHLAFNEAHFTDILIRLERHFGKTIINKNQKLAESRFSAYFEDESLEQIIKYFALGEDFKFKQNGNTILIK